MTAFRLVQEGEAATTLDAMPLNHADEHNLDVSAYLRRAEARRISQLRINYQQRTYGER